MPGCGWSPSSGFLESQLKVWGCKEHLVLGERLANSSPKDAGPQLYSLLLPSGKIWVLQWVGLDGLTGRLERGKCL